MSLVFVAEIDLPSGASSYDLPPTSLTSPVPSTAKIRVTLDSRGRIVSNSGKWPLAHMKLSEDVHRCSAVLQRGSLPETIRLQLVRPLVKNEILTLWFSNELLAAMDVPFLNPINIQGEKAYKCHRCGKIFEYPNPLKLHLARSCDELKLSDLWRRLSDALRLNAAPPIHQPNTNLKSPHEFIMKLSLRDSAIGSSPMKERKLRTKTERIASTPSPTLTSYSSPSPTPADLRIEETRPSSEPPQNSAFRPYYHCLPPGSDSPSLTETTSSYSQPALPSFCDRDVFLQRQAAEIETLVSNLGQSKQGHLCLYCGKIYSRKYGLKIHIRTHTGFKPLKCKYCLRPFGDPSNLNKHVRLHADTETPYRCDLCGKMLVRKRDLDRHIKSRHGNLLP
ncbi:ZnF_C2H2 [Nesidiocoris tenuis]|uniref:ZnF_C2H2 n=1 Tax=Nesidiocoris tenuis TaxID=355587 RepID=A0ABN7AQU0_9HEMI|nr:ZnF_C2H2 [Nesidiocoris tenuis]